MMIRQLQNDSNIPQNINLDANANARAARLEQNRLRAAARRSAETTEQRQARLERDRQRKRLRRSAATESKCKVIVWDECTMAHKKALEALDTTLKDIRECPEIMGGVCVILAGDFRQALPIIESGYPADEINACLKNSILWHEVETMRLTVNMRAIITGDPRAETFSKQLLDIGNGKLHWFGNWQLELTDGLGNIVLPSGFSNIVKMEKDLKEKLYPDIYNKVQMNEKYYDWLCERAILAPKNRDVNSINLDILDDIPGEIVEYKSFDKTLEDDEALRFPTEFLNSQELSGFPQHSIKLKIGAPIILMRNLNAPKLCNGIRLCVKSLKPNIIEAVVLSGCSKGTEVLIPRIPIISKNVPFPFKRVQFPIHLAFAMTINKSQGQSLKAVGVNLGNPCFGHGQLYVACSRVSLRENIYVHSPGCVTKNIAYQQILY